MSSGCAVLSAGSCDFGIARTVTWPLVASTPAGIVSLTPFESVNTCMLVASNVAVSVVGRVVALPRTRVLPALAPADVVRLLTALTMNVFVPSSAVLSWIACTCQLSPAVALSEKVPSAAVRPKALPPLSDHARTKAAAALPDELVTLPLIVASEGLNWKSCVQVPLVHDVDVQVCAAGAM